MLGSELKFDHKICPGNADKKAKHGKKSTQKITFIQFNLLNLFRHAFLNKSNPNA